MPEADKNKTTKNPPIQTQGWYRRFLATKAPNFIIAAAVLTLGIGAIAVGGAPVAMGAVSLAIEMYKVTPPYNKFVKTRVGGWIHNGTKMLFSRLNRRVFKLVMAGIGLAAAAAATGGVVPAIFIGVNIAGVVYNITQEVRELRKARRLCRRASQAKKYKQASDTITQLVGKKPELMKKLGINIAAPGVAPKGKPLNMKATFAKNLAANIWEGAAGLGGAIAGNSGAFVQSMAIVSMTGEISRDTRNDLNAAAENDRLNKIIATSGIAPDQLASKAREQQATALALASTMERLGSFDDPKFAEEFKKTKQQELEKLNSMEPQTPEKWYQRAMLAVKNVVKDIWSLHTSPVHDPVDRAYENYHKKNDKLPRLLQAGSVQHQLNKNKAKSRTTQECEITNKVKRAAFKGRAKSSKSKQHSFTEREKSRTGKSLNTNRRTQ